MDHSTGSGDRGPVDAVALFAVSVVPLGVLGWHRPRAAGLLLLLAAVLPTVFVAAESSRPLASALGGSTAAATLPGVVAGLLYLLAGWFEARTNGSLGPPPARPKEQPVSG